MIGMAPEEGTRKTKRGGHKRIRLTGIRFREEKDIQMKTENVQTTRFRPGWDCTVLCLLHSSPRIYAGPL